MPMTLEQRVRRELEREHHAIELVRRDPVRLDEAWRPRHSEVVAELEAAWERARDAVDALARAVGPEAAQISDEFGCAWSELKTRLRTVVSG